MLAEVTFPDVLDTERLVLRRYSSADARGIFELVDRNRTHLIRNFSPMAKGLSQVEEAISFTEQKAEQWNARKAFCYGIWLRVSKEQVGQLQVKNT
jgi:RimJ/RimL family protein N-acetyltransferase